MNFLQAIVITIALSALPGSILSQSEEIVIGGLGGLDPFTTEDSIRIKLAISGGGARGLTTVGVLKAFEERGIEVSTITGTSFGGVIGGLYACGFNADELREVISNIDFGQLIQNNPPRRSMLLTKRQAQEKHLLTIHFQGLKPDIPKGLTVGQEVTTLLSSLTNKAVYFAGRDFTKLFIPFKTVATDVITGETVILSKGSLADAMRATIAFPLAFTGVEIDGRLLMDGGMVVPVPVRLVSSMGTDDQLVVAINTASTLSGRDALNNPVDIAGQVTTIMTADQLTEQLALADYVINPCPDSITTTDFDKFDSLLAIGYRKGLAAADTIIGLAVSKGTETYQLSVVKVETDDRQLSDQLTARFLGKDFSRHELIVELKKVLQKEQLFELRASIITSSSSTGKTAELLLYPQVYPSIRQGASIRFSGNSRFSDSALNSQISELLPLGRLDFRDAEEQIKQIYRREGYDLAYVKKITFYDGSGVRTNYKADVIEFVIDESPIQKIEVHQKGRTRDWLIRSYFPLHVGEPYSTVKAAAGVQNLFATGLFKQISLNLIPSITGPIVRIDVIEKNPIQLRIGWHFHDEYGSEQFLQLLDQNMFGMGLEFTTNAQYGTDRQKYIAAITAHRIFSTYLTAQAKTFYTRWDRGIFGDQSNELGFRKEERIGVTVLLGQQIARLGTLSAALTFETITQTDSRSFLKEQFDLRTLRLQSVVETFNRYPFPESGEKHLLQFTFAGRTFGGDAEFTRFRTSHEIYIPLTKRVNFHPSLFLGISRTGLPASEKFYIGGADSFIGFHADQLSGDKTFLYRNELRLKLPLYSYLLLRYDVGDVYGSTDQIKLRNLRHAYGAALSFATPLGPFEFAYGVADGDNDRFYFNAGLRF